MAIFYIIQNLFSVLIILRLKKFYGLISLIFFFVIFILKPDTFDIHTYTVIVNQTQNYEIFFAKIIDLISFFVEDDRKVITVYQIIFLCLASSILFFFREDNYKILILAIIFSSVAVMLGVHNNLRQGTASILILLGIFAYINRYKKTSVILTLSSLGFHDSSILFILMIIFSSYFFSNLYKKLNIKGNIRCILLIYALPIFVSFFTSVFTYFLVHYVDHLTIGKTSYINYLRSFNYGEFRTPLTTKALLILILVFTSEIFMKLKSINYNIDLFRYLRIFILMFCLFVSFFENFSEIGNRILYIYYIIDIGLLCLLASNKYYNTVTIILIGYAFAFNVWNIVGGV